MIAFVAAILGIFVGAVFMRCGCECHADEDELDYYDDLDAPRPYHSYEVA